MSVAAQVMGILVMLAGTLLAVMATALLAGARRPERMALGVQGGLAMVALGLAAASSQPTAMQAFGVLVLSAALGWAALPALPVGKESGTFSCFVRACVVAGNAGLPPLPGCWGRLLLVGAGLQVGGAAGMLAAVLALVLLAPGMVAGVRAVQGVYALRREPASDSFSPVAAAVLVLYLGSGLYPGPLLAAASRLAAILGMA